MIESTAEIGRRVQERRRSIRMRQEELAAVLGVTRSAVSQYETGTINISAKDLAKIAKALHVPLGYLFGSESLADVMMREESDSTPPTPAKILDNLNKRIVTRVFEQQQTIEDQVFALTEIFENLPVLQREELLGIAQLLRDIAKTHING